MPQIARRMAKLMRMVLNWLIRKIPAPYATAKVSFKSEGEREKERERERERAVEVKQSLCLYIDPFTKNFLLQQILSIFNFSFMHKNELL